MPGSVRPGTVGDATKSLARRQWKDATGISGFQTTPMRFCRPCGGGSMLAAPQTHGATFRRGAGAPKPRHCRKAAATERDSDLQFVEAHVVSHTFIQRCRADSAMRRLRYHKVFSIEELYEELAALDGADSSRVSA